MPSEVHRLCCTACLMECRCVCRLQYFGTQLSGLNLLFLTNVSVSGAQLPRVCSQSTVCAVHTQLALLGRIGSMAVGRRQACLLLALLAVAITAPACTAEQDSREAHIQLQSAAKVGSDACSIIQDMPRNWACPSAGDSGSFHALNLAGSETMNSRPRLCTACKCMHKLTACCWLRMHRAYCMLCHWQAKSCLVTLPKGRAKQICGRLHGCSWTHGAPSATGWRASSGSIAPTWR